MATVKEFKGHKVPEGAKRAYLDGEECRFLKKGISGEVLSLVGLAWVPLPRRYNKWPKDSIELPQEQIMATVKEFKGHKVPEGATHYGEETSNCFEGFFWKRGDSHAYFWPINGIQRWALSAASSVPSHTVELPQEQYMPEVGEECGWFIGRLAREGHYVGINSLGSFVVEIQGELKSYHADQIEFRPLKTEREKTVDWARSQWLEFSGTKEEYDGHLFDIGALKIPEGES